MGDKFVKLAVYIGAASILIALNASVLKEMFGGLVSMYHAIKCMASAGSKVRSTFADHQGGGVNTAGNSGISGKAGKISVHQGGGGNTAGNSGISASALGPGFSRKTISKPVEPQPPVLSPSASGDRPTWKKQGGSLSAPMESTKAPGNKGALSGMIKSANEKVKNNPSLGMIDPKAAAEPSNDRQKYEMQKSAAGDAGAAAYSSAKAAGKPEEEALRAQKEAIRSTKKEAEDLTANYGQIYGRLSPHERDAVDAQYKSNVDHMNRIQSSYDSAKEQYANELKQYDKDRADYSKNSAAFEDFNRVMSRRTLYDISAPDMSTNHKEGSGRTDVAGYNQAKQLYSAKIDCFGLADTKEADAIVKNSLTDIRLASEVYSRVQNGSRNVLVDYQGATDTEKLESRLASAFVINGYQTIGETRMAAMYSSGRTGMPRGAIDAFEKGTALYSNNEDLRYIGMVHNIRTDSRYSKADSETIVKAAVARINSERLNNNL